MAIRFNSFAIFPWFARARAGARIVLVCPPGLERLLAQNDLWPHRTRRPGTMAGRGADRRGPVFAVIESARGLARLGTASDGSALSSRRRATLRSIWRERLGPATGFRVGLAWAGSPTHKEDRNRSISLEQFIPLLHLPARPLCQPASRSPPPSTASPSLLLTCFPTIPLTLLDFADTAALVSELDLIITVDTAAAHLAGALGRPVWALFAAPARLALGPETRGHALVSHDAPLPAEIRGVTGMQGHPARGG